MYKFTIQHKHCGMVKQVEGFDQWNAYKKNNIDGKMWIVRAIEKGE